MERSKQETVEEKNLDITQRASEDFSGLNETKYYSPSYVVGRIVDFMRTWSIWRVLAFWFAPSVFVALLWGDTNLAGTLAGGAFLAAMFDGVTQKRKYASIEGEPNAKTKGREEISSPLGSNSAGSRPDRITQDNQRV